eukprot:CAMPEP_0174853662 /NCGR_PEP_ID=MMETSP1114-20130205/29385_1 /TAXON_ID=312471 /ORGANISM="Neobodo designis, Strain CCAP 1951/1" /LENGTH=850 /DNA_ID=CAMNT_0016088323 /DNA_START=39 /DNA_END=2591 /DNA_ORIENTATION=+
MNSSPSDVIPAAYVCPIGQDLMTDPVIGTDGNTYERAHIVAWLREHGTSPLTRERMDAAALVPNRNLRDAIESYRAEAARGGNADNRARRAASSRAANTPLAPTVAAPTAKATLELTTPDEEGVSQCLLTVTPPEAPAVGERTPTALVLVIDTSRSMAKEATAVDAEGRAEETGLCVLDIVKHAASTICEMLGPNDRIAIVDFSTSARSGPLVAADAAGKAQIRRQLAGFVPNGSTNLWAGLQSAIAIAKDCTINTSIFVLTDGLPTVTPPSGYERSLERYLASVSTGPCPFTISTFGFGYSLDSQMLSGIASVGRGSFNFIPDAGLVGSVFVNAAATLLATHSAVTRMKLSVPRTVTIRPQSFGFDAVATVHTAVESNGRTYTIDIGATTLGQPRHLAFELVTADDPDASVTPTTTPERRRTTAALYFLSRGRMSSPIDVAVQPMSDPAAFDAHACRQRFAAVVPLIDRSDAGKQRLQDLIAAVSVPTHPLVDALLKDLRGEITLGVSSEAHFKRWAPHYFRSIAAANRCEACNNFKDHSVQLFGGQLFKTLQSAGELAFLSLPAPEPTDLTHLPAHALRPASGAAARPVAAAAPAPPAMVTPTVSTITRRRRSEASGSANNNAAYPTRTAPQRAMNWAYDRGGGCFAPTCTVAMAGGADVRACDVRKGDVLADGRSTVECVVKVRIDAPTARLVRFKSGLLISRYHPIRLPESDGSAAGPWVFPCDAPLSLVDDFDARLPQIDSGDAFVYSLILRRESDTEPTETAAGIVVDGISVAPFAHDCNPAAATKHDTDGALPHAFFGSRATVIEALRQRDGGCAYDAGCVIVDRLVRDSDSQLIVGLETSAQ